MQIATSKSSELQHVGNSILKSNVHHAPDSQLQLEVVYPPLIILRIPQYRLSAKSDIGHYNLSVQVWQLLVLWLQNVITGRVILFNEAVSLIRHQKYHTQDTVFHLFAHTLPVTWAQPDRQCLQTDLKWKCGQSCHSFVNRDGWDGRHRFIPSLQGQTSLYDGKLHRHCDGTNFGSPKPPWRS